MSSWIGAERATGGRRAVLLRHKPLQTSRVDGESMQVRHDRPCSVSHEVSPAQEGDKRAEGIDGKEMAASSPIRRD